MLKELEEYKAEYKKSDAEVQRLGTIIDDLTKLKDKKKAAAVVRKHLDAAKVFETLVDGARNALGPLPPCVREALYYRTMKEVYYPKGSEEWDEVKRRIENGQLERVWNDDEVIGASPRESDAKVQEAIEALDDLGNWLENQPHSFSDWYKQEFDEGIPDMELRPFWEKHLLPASKLPRNRRPMNSEPSKK